MNEVAMEGLIDSFNKLIDIIRNRIARILHGYSLIENWHDSGFNMDTTKYTFDKKIENIYVFYSRDAVIYRITFFEIAHEILKRGSRLITTHVKDFSNIVRSWDKFGYIPPEDMDEIRKNKKEIEEISSMSIQLFNLYKGIEELNSNDVNINYSQGFYPRNGAIDYMTIYLKLMGQTYNRKSRTILEQNLIDYYRRNMCQSLETLDACTKMLINIFSLAGGSAGFAEYRHTAKGLLSLIEEYVTYIENIIKGLDAMTVMMREPIHFIIKTYRH